MIKEHQVKDGRIFFAPKAVFTQPTAVHQCLAKILDDINRDFISEEEFKSNLTILIQDLKSECWTCLSTQSIHVFGSAANGFRSNTSDVDCVVELPENGIDQALCRFKNHLYKSHLFLLKDVIRKATVPIITVIHNKTKLECDISFACPAIKRNDVMNNTKLLRGYSTMYPRIATSFRFLKYVLNSTKFGSVRTNGLSTYTHIILFIYFLTHGNKPHFPHINIETYQIEFNPNVMYQKHLSETEMILGYLKFIACDMNSSRLTIDIRTSDHIERSSSSGSLGRLHIQDPYILSKNLGKFMKDREVYNFKLHCFHLLEFLITCNPSSLNQLQDWCDNYENSLHSDPQIHPDSRPVYQAIRSKKKKSNVISKTPLQTRDYWTLTITHSGHSTSVPVVQTIKPTNNWQEVLGSVVDDIPDISQIVDSSLAQLQCVVVFSKETVVEKVTTVFDYAPMNKLVISSCLNPRKRAHVYLTNYLNGISKQTDVTHVKRIYVYEPSFQLPQSLWRLLRDTIPGQLYFLMPYWGPDCSGNYSEDVIVDKYAQLYSNSVKAYAKYLHTVQLLELKTMLAVNNSNEEECLPDNIEIYQILFGQRAELEDL